LAWLHPQLLTYWINVLNNKKILIFNTILEQKAKEYFTNTLAERITFGEQYSVFHLDEDVPILSKFTHLILSGSELSAAQGSEWDEKIMSVIRHFLKQHKPILGICHGHQILAQTIAGSSVCRRASKPEFGWKKMSIRPNLLFHAITSPVFLESRYDEVFSLPEEFQVIAWNSCAGVQAFQYNDQPVWGVQFHPEMMLDDGTEMVERHLRENPGERRFQADELKDPSRVKESLFIFRNFLNP